MTQLPSAGDPRSMTERMRAGDLYIADDPEIFEAANRSIDGTNLRIGARCFANFGFTALDVAPITIGDDVQIGPHVQLLTPTHPVDPALRRARWEAAKPIAIGDNVWLGGGVVVCPGVTIGDNTVVGAGAVVSRDLPANVVAVGSPARVVKHLDAPGDAALEAHPEAQIDPAIDARLDAGTGR